MKRWLQYENKTHGSDGEVISTNYNTFVYPEQCQQIKEDTPQQSSYKKKELKNRKD